VSDPPVDPTTGPRRLPDMRASDAEREHAVELLRRAATEGRLTVEELEDRLSSAYGARTRSDLDVLVADVSVESITGRAVPAPATPSRVTVREGPGGSRWIVSIMSGHSVRRGPKKTKAERRKERELRNAQGRELER
jgi:uncharacterized protein DUF1707